MDVIGVEATGFIGASVTLILVIIFMILMVILIRQCLQYMAKRNAIREQALMQESQARQVQQRRRLSVTEPVPATFDWHHSIRVEGTPPPTYLEAEELPPLEKVPTKNSIDKYDSIDEMNETKLIEDTKVINSGMTPLISNDLERNRSNTVSGREATEITIAIEPSVIQSPKRTGITPSTPHGSQEHNKTAVRRESPEGDAEFSTAYTQYAAS